MAIPTVDEWRTKLDQFEQQIREGDGNAIIARWHSGKWLFGLKRVKQLPRGTLEMLVFDYKVSRSELTARMKFYQKFSTAEEVTNVVSKFRSWHAIKQLALTDTPRGQKKKPSILRRALKLLEEFKPSAFDEDDVFVLGMMESGVRRYQEHITTLKNRRAVHVSVVGAVGALSAGEM